ncbi:hypothetical protein [Mucilaginibacter sp.]|uniref:hypothetical protein n=1 Tax=Mucilaginibacter sp. TaxID=1882438 RepID=UPI0035BBC569
MVYAVDKSSYTVKDVTKAAFQKQTELVSGIANVEFIFDHYGDGFNITTNDGQQLYYFPIINKVYTKDELNKAEETFATLLPGTKDKAGFAFSNASNDYPEEKRQLIKFVYKDNNGGPKEDPNFEWATAYSALGQKSKVFTNKDRYRLVSYDDFTPGRMYFDPYVLFSSDDYVLIKYKKTAAEKSPVAVQCLSAKTGAIVFTTSLTEDIDPDGAIKYRDGFVIKSFFTATAVGMDGRIIKIFKMN